MLERKSKATPSFILSHSVPVCPEPGTPDPHSLRLRPRVPITRFLCSTAPPHPGSFPGVHASQLLWSSIAPSHCSIDMDGCMPLGQSPTTPAAPTGTLIPSSHRCLCTMALKASPSLQLVVKLCTLTLGYLQTETRESGSEPWCERDSRFLGPALPLSPRLGASRAKATLPGQPTPRSSSGTTAARHPWLTSSPCCLLFPH